MRFILQIIYLNESVLKLFIPWICFFIIMRFPDGRVFCKGDTWLRTGAIGSVAAAGALGRDGTQACPADPWSP